jgi:hypothetical protein
MHIVSKPAAHALMMGTNSLHHCLHASHTTSYLAFYPFMGGVDRTRDVISRLASLIA